MYQSILPAVRFLESQVHALEDRLKRYSEPTVTLGLIVSLIAVFRAVMFFFTIFMTRTAEITDIMRPNCRRGLPHPTCRT